MAHSSASCKYVAAENRVSDSEFLHIIADVLSRDGQMELVPEDIIRLEEIAMFLDKCPSRIGIRIPKASPINERLNS